MSCSGAALILWKHSHIRLSTHWKSQHGCYSEDLFIPVYVLIRNCTIACYDLRVPCGSKCVSMVWLLAICHKNYYFPSIWAPSRNWCTPAADEWRRGFSVFFSSNFSAAVSRLVKFLVATDSSLEIKRSLTGQSLMHISCHVFFRRPTTFFLDGFGTF